MLFRSFLLLLLSPMAIYYSQDANHYAPVILAGLLAVMAIDNFLCRGLRGLPFYVALCGCQALVYLHHPMALFPLLASGLAPLVYLYHHVDRVGPATIPVARKRLILLLFVVLCAAIAAHLLLERYGSAWNHPPLQGRRFGLGWDFLSTMAASFFAGIFFYATTDYILGLSATLLAVVGCLGLLRSRQDWSLGLGILLVLGGTFGPFLLISTKHYFSPRYVATALVPLLLCLAHGLVLLWGRRTLLPRWGIAILALWCLVYAGRSLQWNIHRLGGDFQPSVKSLRWIADNTPEDSVIITRNKFQSVGTRFLWDREDMGNRTLRALSDSSHSSQVAIEQIHESIHETGLPHYIQFVDGIERFNFGFSVWLDEQTEQACLLESWSPDSFVPITRDVSINRVLAPPSNPFLLPRRGDTASHVYPENVVTYGSGRLRLSGPSGAAWRFELPEAIDGIDVVLAHHGTADPASRILAVINDNVYLLANLPPGREEWRVQFPVSLEAGRHQMDLLLPAFPGPMSRQQELHIMTLSSSMATTESITALPLSPVANIWAKMSLTAEEIEQIPIGTSLQDPTLSLAPYTRVEGGVLLIQRQMVGGLGDRGLISEWRTSTGRRIPMGPRHTWLYGPAYRAVLLPIADAELGQWVNRLQAAPDFRPRDPYLEFSSINVLRVPPELLPE